MLMEGVAAVASESVWRACQPDEGVQVKSGLRLLPLTIFVATLMLTVKVGSIWQTVASAQDGGLDDRVSQNAQQGFDGGRLQLAQAAAQDASDSGAEDAFDAFADETPEGFDDVLTTDEEDKFSDIASLTPGELRLLHDLADRRRDIESKEREISVREDLLRAAEYPAICAYSRRTRCPSCTSTSLKRLRAWCASAPGRWA